MTLYLADYEYKGETKQGVRLKLPAPGTGDGAAVVLPPRKRDDLNDEIPF